VAPALKEVPLEANVEALEFANHLQQGHFDMVIFLTGVGARLLYRVIDEKQSGDTFLAALRSVLTVVRGPKPSAVLREWQVPIGISVPEPNTWRELLAAIAGRSEKRVALQEYGRPNPELLAGLEAQGRTVTRVRVYSWALPDDTQPLREALTRLLAGNFQIALFTTSVQIEHFLEFAQQQGQLDDAKRALSQLMIASIGPTCSEALRASGIEPALEPSHPKMGILVREAALHAAKLFAKENHH
jgi:uroporphyrinogen-III synthase